MLARSIAVDGQPREGGELMPLTFYEGDHVVNHTAFSPAVIDEYLRSFAGPQGVLGSLGVYRAAFASIDQTEPLMAAKITVPVVALGGEKGLGSKVGDMVAMVADKVEAHTLAGCGHFMPEERPRFVVDQIVALSVRVAEIRAQERTA
jgi:pimeloyl-ACP methyl ester carboxylesterase